MKNYVLDTSALITLQSDEEGSDTVEEILEQAVRKKVTTYVSFVTWTEIFYITYQRFGRDKAIEVLAHLKALPMKRVDPDEDMILLAGELKAGYPVSLADAYVAATCIQKQSILIHKDPDFEHLKDRMTLHPLPYKGLH